ncbi:MAG TPA: hypothetical protein PKL57_18695 [Candidatus Wallbacteria bacterium]|nr:hypothetical protein [Candidatus Wallbacteria bacterium]
MLKFIMRLSIIFIFAASNFCTAFAGGTEENILTIKNAAEPISAVSTNYLREREPEKKYYCSKIISRTFSKLEKANSDIYGLETTVKNIAPAIGHFTNWNDRITGYSGLIFGKKINKTWDYNLVFTFGRGSIDTHNSAVIQTADPQFAPLNGAGLKADFRQEYVSKTIGFGPKYNKKFKNFDLGASAVIDFIDFNSYTDYALNAPGFSRIVSAHFKARKFYAAFSLSLEKRIRRNTKIVLFMEYVPSCKLTGEAIGDDTVNGAYSKAAIPAEIDISSKKPHIGLMLTRLF